MSSDPHGHSSTMPEIPVPSPSNMSIDTKKQSETILWISIPSTIDAVPLVLRSCMTMSPLFDAVFRICGLSEQQQQDKVLGLRTTLDWTGGVGVKKYLMLRRDFEDTFQIFLKVINASPCWEQEGGYCSVAIEVVLA